MPKLDDTLAQLLAMSREAGTPAGARAREIVADHLTALGYHVAVQRFTFFPSTLLAFPVFGAGLGWLALVLTPLLVTGGVSHWVPLVVWSIGLIAITVLAVSIGLGWVHVSLGGTHEPREDANLIATRSDRPVGRWIVAHLDSKAQGHSMAGRLVAVWFVVVAIVALTAMAVIRLRAPVPLGVAVLGGALTLAAAALAGRGRLRGGSPGARDNGTGVAAALAAAEAVTDSTVGILITGAEEFGLVGARIFVQQAGRLDGIEVVNVDTVDDEGILTLVTHDAGGRRLASCLGNALAGVAPPLRERRLPLGIFVDSVPLAKAGADALTIGRLTWRTLRRIHTPQDTPDRLSLTTAIQVGQALARIPRREGVAE